MDQTVPNEESPNGGEHGEKCFAALTKIRDLLENKSNQEALVLINSSPENFISDLIEAKKYDIHFSSHILQLLKQKCPADYISTLVQNLQSKSDVVRKFAIEQIFNLTKEDKCALDTLFSSDALVTITHMVGDKETSVFNKAILVLSEVDLEKHTEVLEALKVPLKGNKTSMCNAFDVIVNLSIKSESNLQKCSNAGFTDLMIDELIKSRDILYQLNILELLTRLVVTPHGFSYFSEREIFESIADMVTTVCEQPTKSLLFPGFLKFFGAVAHLHPSGALSYYSAVVECLFDALESGDRSLLPVALDTLGYVGSTIEGKLCLPEFGARFQSVIAKVSEYIRNSPTEIKVRALECMQGLIGLERDPKHSESSVVDLRVTLMTREWFRSINPLGDAMEALYENCKNPFPDIRSAAFGLLDAVCQHQWGCELVANTPGLIEYLLDRSVDHTKQSKESKYAIIKRLSQSAAFDPTVIVKMTSYLEQGVFFTETTHQLAMEEDN